MPSPVVLIISAPSGAGKTSLARALVATRADTVLAVSHTTRPMRVGEKDGEDYYFVDNNQFDKMIANNQFLEYATVFNNRYGTSADTVKSQLSCLNNVILNIDWQGARSVRAKFPRTISVFIMPPSIDDLESRLKARNQDSDIVITKRMKAATSEISHSDEYQYKITNDDFDTAASQLSQILEQTIGK